MTVSKDDLPTADEIQEAQNSAEQLLEKLQSYRQVAGEIDANFEKQNEHRNLSLGDMPYGEELIRTRELPAKVEGALEVLERIEEGTVPEGEVPEAFASALKTVESAQAELDDCKSLPEDSDESED